MKHFGSSLTDIIEAVLIFPAAIRSFQIQLTSECIRFNCYHSVSTSRIIEVVSNSSQLTYFLLLFHHFWFLFCSHFLETKNCIYAVITLEAIVTN